MEILGPENRLSKSLRITVSNQAYYRATLFEHLTNFVVRQWFRMFDKNSMIFFPIVELEVWKEKIETRVCTATCFDV